MIIANSVGIIELTIKLLLDLRELYCSDSYLYSPPPPPRRDLISVKGSNWGEWGEEIIGFSKSWLDMTFLSGEQTFLLCLKKSLRVFEREDIRKFVFSSLIVLNVQCPTGLSAVCFPLLSVLSTFALKWSTGRVPNVRCTLDSAQCKDLPRLVPLASKTL